MKKEILFVFIAVLAGCSSLKSTEKVSNSDGEICKLEKTTGSNIATRVCRTVEQIEFEEKLAKEAMKEMTRGSIKNGK